MGFFMYFAFYRGWFGVWDFGGDNVKYRTNPILV